MPEIIAISVRNVGLVCPHCNAVEDQGDGTINIRGFKVHMTEEHGWESHCIICGTWFDEVGRITALDVKKTSICQEQAAKDTRRCVFLD